MSKKTKTLVFQGYSDDTFGEYRETNVDYDNSASGRPIVFEVVSGRGKKREGLLAIGQYCPEGAGGWLVGVAPHPDIGDGDGPIPEWPITIERSERSYSPSLVIEVPANAI